MDLTQLHIKMEEDMADAIADAIEKAPMPNTKMAQKEPKNIKKKQVTLSNRTALYEEPNDTTQRRGVVYLIHFDQPLHHAQHYVGFTENLAQRLHEHDTNGSPLIRAINQAGIPWRVSRIWENVKQGYERYLKDQKNIRRFCPICKQSPLTKKMADREPSKICIMANLSEKDSSKIQDLVKSIPEKDLYKEGDEYGREKETHATILYGLLPGKVTLDDVKESIADYGPVEMTLGKVNKFENDKYDVLKIDVESTDLGALNERLSELPNENDYDDYKPHITLAYVKKGTQNELVGDTRFEGDKITVNAAIFSPGDGGKKESIPLSNKKEGAWGGGYQEYWLTPNGTLQPASQGHYLWLRANNILDEKNKHQDDMAYMDAYGKGYVRCIKERGWDGEILYYEGYPKPSQLRELRDYAIENHLELRKAQVGRLGPLLVTPSGEIIQGKSSDTHWDLAERVFPEKELTPLMGLELDQYIISRGYGFARFYRDNTGKGFVISDSPINQKQLSALQDFALEHNADYDYASYGKTKYYALSNRKLVI